MSIARRAAAVLAPEWLKQRHEAYSTGRYRERVRALTREFERRQGLTVKRGPFAGLTYPESLADADFLVAKLLGLYEQEVHDAIKGWISREPALVVNIGAAEGYFAVGLARALPGATVLAFELDDETRAQCVELAEANGVAERVRPAGECTLEDLARVQREDVVVLCDCEGCELELLDPVRVPAMREWDLLVELHDFVNPAISTKVPARFSQTHSVGLIPSRPRDDDVPPELSDLRPTERRLLLSERRPAPMEWARMTPREA
jgi:hypothetical protein